MRKKNIHEKILFLPLTEHEEQNFQIDQGNLFIIISPGIILLGETEKLACGTFGVV